MNPNQTRGILSEVHRERARQDLKFGPQSTRDYADYYARTNHDHHSLAEERARNACDLAARAGKCTWEHIVDEEYAEALSSAAVEDTPALRHELVQLAAVVVAWIEAIDNRESRREGILPPLESYGKASL